MGKRGPRYWPGHTDAIVHQYQLLGSTRAVALKLHISRGKVIRHLRHAGVEMRPGGWPSHFP